MSLAFRSLQIVSLAALLLAAGALLGLRHQGYQLLSVQSNSMAPDFQRGDSLVVKPIKLSDLRVGNIVSYHHPARRRVIISHRLIAIDKTAGRLTTAGDAMHSPDSAFPTNLVIGRAQAVMPKFGYVQDFLRRRLTLVLV